ncbi:ATP-binding cassette sub-family C member 3-like [Zophobas morio]|uniref:ATP-binding cassette sub-family C member 3-like n=1 Tax=Zophobas morio TaxID=2755281 RepID=UPI0030830825
MCDYIYTMLNGEIKEEGTFETLKKKGGVFSAFIAEHMKESDEQSNEQSFTNVREGVVETTEKNIRKLSKTSLKSMKSIEAGELPNAQQRKGILVVEENVEQGDIKLAVFVIYCRAIGWITILLVISIFFIGQGFQIYTNIWLSRWSSAGANASKDISYWLGVYTALGLAYSLSNMLTSFSLAFGSIHASKNLHETVVKRLLKAPLSFFDTTLLGRIVNRLSKDIYTIDEALPNSLKSFLNTFFSVLGTIFIIAFATPKFLIIVLPLLLLYIVIQRFYVSSSRQLKRLESVSRSPIFAHFQETNHGVSTIRAYGREERFIKENIAVLEYNQRSYYPSISSNRWLAIRLESIGNMVVFFASLFAVVSRNSISSALVGLSLSHAMNITQSLNWMVRMSSECETNIVAVERIDEYTKIPQEREEEKDDLEGISSDTDKVTLATLSSTDTWPSHGVVEFKNYSARHELLLLLSFSF